MLLFWSSDFAGGRGEDTYWLILHPLQSWLNLNRLGQQGEGPLKWLYFVIELILFANVFYLVSLMLWRSTWKTWPWPLTKQKMQSDLARENLVALVRLEISLELVEMPHAKATWKEHHMWLHAGRCCQSDEFKWAKESMYASQYIWVNFFVQIWSFFTVSVQILQLLLFLIESSILTVKTMHDQTI